MRKILLHDADKTKYPNLVLMKSSAWHKITPFAQPYRDSEGGEPTID